MKIELKKPGEEATLAITAVEVLAGDKGNMVRFTTPTGDELSVSEGAVARQLDLCKVAEIPELAGRILHFSRKANKNPAHQPYWNISLATAEDVRKMVLPPKPNGKPPGEEEETGPPPVDLKAEVFAAHSRCFKHVCDKYVPYAAEKGVELSLEGVSALTAQLWIELNKRGIA